MAALRDFRGKPSYALGLSKADPHLPPKLYVHVSFTRSCVHLYGKHRKQLTNKQ